MKTPVSAYIVAARRFAQLARIERRYEAKQLMIEQAETCIKLAARRAKGVDAPHSQMPPPIDWAG